MRKIIIFCLVIWIFISVYGTESDSLKVRGIEAFKSENYSLAIDFIKQAISINDNDTELYYYLGFFMHYQANDSRPLIGYNLERSEEIFGNLEKAIRLKADFGDAKYFYGAECSANAFNSMYKGDLKALKYYYQKAEKIGAYPDWLKEFGQNILESCPKNAILFTG